jgi:hypothetical protein
MVAFCAVRETRKTNILFDEADTRLRLEIKAEADEHHGGCKKWQADEYFRLDGSLYDSATPLQFTIVEEFEKQMDDLKNGRGPVKMLQNRLEFTNEKAIQRLVDSHLIGFGTLVTSKLVAMAESPLKYGVTEGDDIAPGALVKSGGTVSTNVVEEDEEKQVPVTVKMATGETIAFDDLTPEYQRDVRRGFGVTALRVSKNPIRTERFTGYNRSHTTQMPPPINFVPIINPNGTMNDDEWEDIMPNPFDNVDYLGRQVLTMTLHVYTSGPEHVQYVTKNVKVCPAPPPVIALYKRSVASDAVRRNFAEDRKAREKARVVKRQRDERENGRADRAKKMSLHRPAGTARDREYHEHMVNLRFREDQDEIHRRFLAGTLWSGSGSETD